MLKTDSNNIVFISGEECVMHFSHIGRASGKYLLKKTYRASSQPSRVQT